MNSPYGLPAECVDCHLRADNFFCALSRESLAVFSQIRHSALYPEGAVIFTQGQSPRGIFTLCEGQAKLSCTSSEGKTLIMRIVRPGEVLGLDAVVTGKRHEVTAETMQPCRLNYVSREDILRFLAEHGDACLNAARHVSRDCRDAYDLVRSIGSSHTASRRVAKFLLEWATGGKVRNGVVRAKLALTHEDIAQLVGSSRETITRTLATLRKKDIVELKDSTLTIHNKPALELLAVA